MKTETTLQKMVLTMTATALIASLAAPGSASPVPQEDPAPPAIEVQKLTNGVDVDFAPGPVVAVGETVDWTYVITNVGGFTLHDLAIADTAGVEISCASPETLEPGEMIACGATMVAELGPFSSEAVVAAATQDGFIVDDSDPAYHYGELFGGSKEPSISINKLVNGIDADTAPGPSLQVGETINWSYVVTNTGGVTLDDVALTDISMTGGQGSDISCADTETLEPGESMVCGSYDTVAPGPHLSLGVVTAVATDGTLVDARDPSYHVGI